MVVWSLSLVGRCLLVWVGVLLLIRHSLASFFRRSVSPLLGVWFSLRWSLVATLVGGLFPLSLVVGCHSSWSFVVALFVHSVSPSDRHFLLCCISSFGVCLRLFDVSLSSIVRRFLSVVDCYLACSQSVCISPLTFVVCLHSYSLIVFSPLA